MATNIKSITKIIIEIDPSARIIDEKESNVKVKLVNAEFETTNIIKLISEKIAINNKNPFAPLFKSCGLKFICIEMQIPIIMKIHHLKSVKFLKVKIFKIKIFKLSKKLCKIALIVILFVLNLEMF